MLIIPDLTLFIIITCEWTSLWKLLADCTSTMPDYCSADVFTGRHISSYNMVQFECLSTCVQCSHSLYMYHLMTCGDAPNCTWTDLAMPTLAGVNCAKQWEESI